MNKIFTNKKINDLNYLKCLLKNKKFTLVHGVFDVLHIGHKRHFETAKKLTGLLVVSLTSDKYVKKGPGRPYFNQFIRSEMVSSLEIFISFETAIISPHIASDISICFLP